VEVLKVEPKLMEINAESGENEEGAEGDEGGDDKK
jgi:hypothetical protein